MTVPDFSVLLLAWDAADPSVAVLGGAALPPTLPLVYHLAAEQPVLAVFPHLPAGHGPGGGPEAPAPTAVKTAAAQEAPAASATAAPADADVLRTPVPMPGVRLLSVRVLLPEAPPAPARAASRLVGLAELAPLAAADATPAPPPARSQWPAGARAPRAGAGQVPAAPYLGSALATTAPAAAPPPLPAPPVPPPASVLSTATSALTPAEPLTPNGPAQPPADSPHFGHASELPTLLQPAAFEETSLEIGPAEAADLSAPEDDLVPEPAVPARPAVAPAAAATPAPAPGSPRPRVPALDGLNARMIQYARHAAQLVDGRADYAVIYAPNWPAWLAALEIRNRTGRPLVLYVAALAADFAAPAERGWLLEIERMTLRRAALILVPTEALGVRVRAQYGATIGPIQVVAAHDEAAIQRVLGTAAGQ